MSAGASTVVGLPLTLSETFIGNRWSRWRGSERPDRDGNGRIVPAGRGDAHRRHELCTDAARESFAPQAISLRDRDFRSTGSGSVSGGRSGPVGSGVRRTSSRGADGELRDVHLDLGERAARRPLEVEARDALLQVLDQAAQLLHRGRDRLVAAHRAEWVTREIVSMFSLMCAVVDDCSSLEARTCWMQASIRSALPMIASSAPPALSTSSLPRSTCPPTRDIALDRASPPRAGCARSPSRSRSSPAPCARRAAALPARRRRRCAPWRPARAASMAALSESSSVWSAICSITRVIAPICSLLRPSDCTVRAEMPTVVTISSIPAKVSRTMRPPSCASVPERCAISDASAMLRRAARHRLRHLLGSAGDEQRLADLLLRAARQLVRLRLDLPDWSAP